MGLFDALKKSLAKQAAEEGGRQAVRGLGAAVDRLAGEFLDDAEAALADARAARGLDAPEAPAPGAAATDDPVPATAAAPRAPATPPAPSYADQRRARQQAAADELARLKAAREARVTDAATPPKKTL